MDELARKLDGKLTLEDVPESDSKSQSGPVRQQPDSGRPYHLSGLDAAPEEAIPETEANSSPRKPQQMFSFTFDGGSLRTAANPGRSTGDKALNPSAPVWTPSPSTTKEQPLPIRFREGPSRQTSRSEETLKHEKCVQRSVGNEAHNGAETQMKATSSEPRAVNAKADRQSQTLCRNVVMYGHCRNEGVGCGFKHP